MPILYLGLYTQVNFNHFYCTTLFIAPLYVYIYCIGQIIFPLSIIWQMSTRKPMVFVSQPIYQFFCLQMNKSSQCSKEPLNKSSGEPDLPPVLWQNNDVPRDAANLFLGAKPWSTDTHFTRPIEAHSLNTTPSSVVHHIHHCHPITDVTV